MVALGKFVPANDHCTASGAVPMTATDQVTLLPMNTVWLVKLPRMTGAIIGNPS